MKTLLKISLFAFLLACVGCGAKTGDVSGKVTYQGKPVVYGSVVIVGPDGIPKSGAIQPDGSYSVAGVGVGEAKVAVSSPQPDGAGKAAGDGKAKGGRDADADDKTPPPGAAAAPPVKGWFALPPESGDTNKSGLKVTVGGGTTTFDIPLK
jgi:hypothetical protein